MIQILIMMRSLITMIIVQAISIQTRLMVIVMELEMYVTIVQRPLILTKKTTITILLVMHVMMDMIMILMVFLTIPIIVLLLTMLISWMLTMMVCKLNHDYIL